MEKYIPTVVFDFDGVIHSYKSGWMGDAVIPDPPVPGIKEAISIVRENGYRVVVVSTRCATQEGMTAVTEYLERNEIVVDDVMKTKPAAVCYVDDRAICFDGDAASLVDKILNFKTWMEREEKTVNPVEHLRPVSV